jgi:hypothetical protein
VNPGLEKSFVDEFQRRSLAEVSGIHIVRRGQCIEGMW